jgi:hypothetical protein
LTNSFLRSKLTFRQCSLLCVVNFRLQLSSSHISCKLARGLESNKQTLPKAILHLNFNMMSLYLRFIIFSVCVSISVLAATMPNTNTMNKVPNAKAVRSSKLSKSSRNKERYDSSVNEYLSEVSGLLISLINAGTCLFRLQLSESLNSLTRNDFYCLQRICGFNELCKEEFNSKFRCRCPLWSYCSSPGRYYNAYCTMSGAGGQIRHIQWVNPIGNYEKKV